MRADQAEGTLRGWLYLEPEVSGEFDGWAAIIRACLERGDVSCVETSVGRLLAVESVDRDRLGKLASLLESREQSALAARLRAHELPEEP